LLRSRENLTATNSPNNGHDSHETSIKTLYEIEKHESRPDTEPSEEVTVTAAATSAVDSVDPSQGLLSKADIKKQEKKGLLTCNNVTIDSEIIYWKEVTPFTTSYVLGINQSLTHILGSR